MQNLHGLRGKIGRKWQKMPFCCLHHWLGWGAVLITNIFEFFFKLKSSNIIHPTQLVYLSQSQFGFAQIAKLNLTIIVLDVLIAFGIRMKKFKQ
jgi:hypothetical protein